MFDLGFLSCFFCKNGNFLCSLERKFPDFFKTHPTFVFSPILMPSMACQTLIPLFFGTPCTHIALYIRIRIGFIKLAII